MDLEHVRQRLTPSAEEMDAVRQATEDIIKQLSGPGRELVAGGSTSKGTSLAGNFDIDIFVRFKNETEALDDKLEILMQELDISYERVHGSRDYFTFTYKGFFFEIVPVKYVTRPDDAENVTDMSPLHVTWAKEHLNDNLRSDIRLAKQFCKASGTYGAESYINGISGHVIDILLIHYGSFDNFIHAAANWNKKTIIDPEGKHDNPLASLNEAKTQSPLILIDPVDPSRNAAAALGEEKYTTFIDVAKHYLEHPSEEFFIVRKLTPEQLQAHKTGDDALLILHVTPLAGKPDITYTKVLKVQQHLHRELEQHGFTVHQAGWQPANLIYFYVDAQPLEKDLVRQGPPANQEHDVKKFKEVNNDTFLQNGYWHVKEQRPFTIASELVQHLCEQEYVQSRVKNIRLSPDN